MCLRPEWPIPEIWDRSSVIEECEAAPRINELPGAFASTASGHSRRPLNEPQVDRRLLDKGESLRCFIRLHERRRGPLDQYYHSSIPYRLDEEYRIGHAILQYSQDRPGTLHLYTLGAAEGTMARTVSELADGRIESLCCIPNVRSYRSFLARRDHPHVSFFVGPFHHLTRDLLSSRQGLRRFLPGFDIILEDRTFEMYSSDRFAQIEVVSQHLKDDGLFIFIEKFKHEDIEEYMRRELQKEHDFKARYFSHMDVVTKEKEVLPFRNRNEVTLEEMATALQRYFVNCYVTWNSGNMYTLVASNNMANIDRFIASGSESASRNEHLYESLPRPLFGEREQTAAIAGVRPSSR